VWKQHTKDSKWVFPPFYWVLKKEKRKKEIEKKEKRGKLVSIPYSM
jgi:hypothetical protein